MWRHESRPLTFTLVVDDFGIKFVNKSDVDHLISSIKTMYSLTIYIVASHWITGLGLRRPYGRHLDARIHQTEIKGVQTCHAPEKKKFGTEAQSPFP